MKYLQYRGMQTSVSNVEVVWRVPGSRIRNGETRFESLP